MAIVSRLNAEQRRRCVLLGGYALLTLLSFPHPVAGRVLDLGLFLGWMGPLFLLLALDGLPPRRALRWAFFAGLAAHFPIFHWFYVVTVVYGHAPAAVGLLAPLAPALYIALFTLAFGGLWAWLRARDLASPFAAAAVWVALDHARSWLLSGFPWATLGYSQHHNLPLLGLSSLTGVYGLSFVCVLLGAAAFEAVVARRAGRSLPRSVVAALAVAALAHGLGWLAAPRGDADAQVATLRVAALQGNIDQGVKWDRAWVERTLQIYESLTREAAEEGALLVAWPETAVPGALEFDPRLRERIERLAQATGTVLVVGGMGVALGDGGRVERFYDSAFAFGSGGDLLGRYDKSHLVPFGEYVPLRAFIGGLVGAVATGIASGDVTPGAGPEVVEVEGMRAGEPLRLGLPICYELLFPDLMRHFGRRGAALLVALTNDAWYGRTGAPYQFLAMTALRSAESGLWTMRAANTGVSAVIDDRGRVLDATEIFTRGMVMADLPVTDRAPGPRTFYARHGDLFAGACWLATAALLVTGALRRGRER